MTIVLVLDDGFELRVKCEDCEITRNGFGVITNIHFSGIKENKPLFLPTERLKCVYRVLSDEKEGEEDEGNG